MGTTKRQVRVMGFDPGLAHTGYGIVDVDASADSVTLVAHGDIKTKPEDSTHTRVRQIAARARVLFEQYRPDYAFAESYLNYGRVTWNGAQTLYCLGVVIGAGERCGLSVEPIGAREAKLAIGVRDGQKSSVQERTRVLLGLDKVLRPTHAADAVAVALAGLKKLRATLDVAELRKGAA